MLPRLFDFSTTLSDFNNKLGLGYIAEVISGEVKEVLNGEYTLRMTISQNDRLASSIAPDKCIWVKPNYSDGPQIFVITAINYSDKGTIEVNAEHIKTMFFNNVVLGNNQQEETELTGTPSTIVNGLLSQVLATNHFTFSSNISTSKTIKRRGTTLTIGEVFNDSENGLITRFKNNNPPEGDLKYNNFTVNFLSHRGKTSAENVVRYGTKISSFKQEMSNKEEYSHVLAYATVATKDAYEGSISSVTLYGRQGNTYLVPTNSSTGITKVLPVDFSNKFTNKHGYVNPSNGDGYVDVENTLYSYGEDYVASHSSISAPSVNVVADYNTVLDDLNKVALGDVVKVIYDPLGYAINHRVTATVYDFINERYKSVTIGEKKFTLYDYIYNKFQSVKR